MIGKLLPPFDTVGDRAGRQGLVFTPIRDRHLRCIGHTLAAAGAPRGIGVFGLQEAGILFAIE